MIATKSRSLFTPEPHYIPGYAGFYPQLRYQVGYTYGRTTAHVLTDPTVNKSPCSVLAPLTKPKLTEDVSQNKISQAQHTDADQPYIPHYTGFQPFKDFETGAHDPSFGPEQHGTPGLDSSQDMLLTGTGTEPMPYPPYPQYPTSKVNEPEIGHPGLRLAYGKEGWKTSPSPSKTSACPQLHLQRDVHPSPPPHKETLEVGRFEKLPKLDKPNLIQHKAISGYAGFVPRFTWVMGMNYREGVQQAMDEFSKNQMLEDYCVS